jgi:hypothetical protein
VLAPKNKKNWIFSSFLSALLFEHTTHTLSLSLSLNTIILSHIIAQEKNNIENCFSFFKIVARYVRNNIPQALQTGEDNPRTNSLPLLGILLANYRLQGREFPPYTCNSYQFACQLIHINNWVTIKKRRQWRERILLELKENEGGRKGVIHSTVKVRTHRKLERSSDHIQKVDYQYLLFEPRIQWPPNHSIPFHSI